jgi:hypothetical protein
MVKKSSKTINKKKMSRADKRKKTTIMMSGGTFFWKRNHIMMEVNNEEPLFVLELTPEDKEPAPECHATMAENSTKVLKWFICFFNFSFYSNVRYII